MSTTMQITHIFTTICLLLKLRSKIRHRTYLTNHAIVKPAVAAWMQLLQQADDAAFINSTGFDRNTFQYIYQLLQPYRDDLVPQHRKRGRPHTLDLYAQLGLTLYFLNSTMKQKTLAALFGAGPTRISVAISEMLPLLLQVLENDPYSRIEWPNAQMMAQYTQQIRNRHPNLGVDVFGFMDGVFFPCYNHKDPQIQNAYYNGWKRNVSVTNILVFAPDGTVIAAATNYAGSFHDAKVAASVYQLLQHNTPQQYHLLADAAFQFQHPQIVTPYKRGQVDRNNPARARQQIQRHCRIVSARQPAEWGMRVLQGMFGRLSSPLSASNVRYNGVLINVCLHLCNLRVRRMGVLNQIHTVFDTDNYVHNVFRERNAHNNQRYLL